MGPRIWIFRAFLLSVSLLVIPYTSLSQGSQQIASRKIREVITTTFDDRKGQEETTTLTERFNSKGLIIERIETNKKGEVILHELFEYGKKKRLIYHTILNNISGKPDEVVMYTYDKWGNEVVEEHVGPDNKSKQKIVSRYDLSGKKILEEVYDGSGKLQKLTSNTYDKRGMLLVRTVKDGNGKVVYTKSNTYSY